MCFKTPIILIKFKFNKRNLDNSTAVEIMGKTSVKREDDPRRNKLLFRVRKAVMCTVSGVLSPIFYGLS